MNTTITKVFRAEQPNGDICEFPIVFREDGYISATSVSKSMKKRLDHFWTNEETKSYIQELSKITGIPGNMLVVAKRGRNGGTYLHPKMAVRLARWLSIPFEVWCDLMIDNILRGNIQTTVAVPSKEALAVNQASEDMKARILGLEKEVRILQDQVALDAIPEGHSTPGDYLNDASPVKPSKEALKEFGEDCAAVARKMNSVIYRKQTYKAVSGAKPFEQSFYSPRVLDAAFEMYLSRQNKPTKYGFVMPSHK